MERKGFFRLAAALSEGFSARLRHGAEYILLCASMSTVLYVRQLQIYECRSEENGCAASCKRFDCTFAGSRFVCVLC